MNHNFFLICAHPYYSHTPARVGDVQRGGELLPVEKSMLVFLDLMCGEEYEHLILNQEQFPL